MSHSFFSFQHSFAIYLYVLQLNHLGFLSLSKFFSDFPNVHGCTSSSVYCSCTCPIVLLTFCQVQFTPGWKSAEWTWRWVDLWNNLGFSLYAVLSVCHVVTTSDNGKKSKIGVSADWYITVEHQGSSSIRVIFVNYQTSKL